jgi:2-polyprenyl-3-methyl-5-hydroxy-6-metoxy-1,4-benzoquinol methylase
MFTSNNTDKDWKAWGKENPYFGVISDPKYIDSNLNDERLREFFVSGERHVYHVMNVVREAYRDGFRPSKALDYGCGVGRLVIPFARCCESVIGVDIAPGMLEQAQANCQKFGIENAKLIGVEEMKSIAPGTIDFIHSVIVFQHIPTERGEQILKELIALLTEGGFGAIHFNFSDSGRSTLQRWIAILRRRLTLAHRFLNLLQGRRFTTPLMQMNSYSMNRIFDVFIRESCGNLRAELSDHGGFHGAMVYFEKMKNGLGATVPVG